MKYKLYINIVIEKRSSSQVLNMCRWVGGKKGKGIRKYESRDETKSYNTFYRGIVQKNPTNVSKI